jgi:organic hydroperoxide reductase OsmC/OhrA
MTDERTYHVTVSLKHGYEFVATFPSVDRAPAVVFDEPEPLGSNHAPNAAAVLGAAVGDCLAASLAFCLRRARVVVDDLSVDVATHIVRNENGRFRIGSIDVELGPEIGAADLSRLERCEELFEDFCIVTQSVRQGIPVNVKVRQVETAPAG